MRSFLLVAMLLFVIAPGRDASSAEAPDALLLRDRLHVQLKVEYPPSMSDEAFRAAVARIDGRPEHPMRASVERERRRREVGPDVVMYDLWLDGPRVVRYNTSNTHDALYTDYASDRDAMWSMSPQSLNVLPTSNAEAAPGAPAVGAQLAEAEQLVAWLASWGRALAEALPVGAWVETDKGLVASGEGIELVQRWDAGRGVASVVVTKCEPDPSAVGLKWSFGGSSLLGGAGGLAPAVFEEFTADGLVERRVSVVSVEPISQERLATVRRLPRFDGEDAVRGPVTFVARTDYRATDPEVTVLDGDGAERTRSEGARTGSLPVVRIGGWVLAGGLAVGLVYLRVRHT